MINRQLTCFTGNTCTCIMLSTLKSNLDVAGPAGHLSSSHWRPTYFDDWAAYILSGDPIVYAFWVCKPVKVENYSWHGKPVEIHT